MDMLCIAWNKMSTGPLLGLLGCDMQAMVWAMFVHKHMHGNGSGCLMGVCHGTGQVRVIAGHWQDAAWA